MLMKFGADILKSSTHRDILPPFTSETRAHKTRFAILKEGRKPIRMSAYTLGDNIFKLLHALLRQVLQQQSPEVEVIAHHSYILALSFCAFV